MGIRREEWDFFFVDLKTKGVMDRRWSRKADRGGNECR